MEVTFSAQIIPDTFQTFKVNSDAAVKDVVKEVLRAMAAQGHQVNPSEYRILVTYQLTVPETSLEKLTSEQAVIANDSRLQDINFKDGFSILFVKPIEMSTKLELWIQNKKIKTLDRHETLLGRPDPDQDFHPDLDLTPYLGQFEFKVSRRQVYILEEEGKWKIRLVQDAKSPVFLDEKRLQDGRTYEISDESVIAFGTNPEQPYLRIFTKFASA